MVDDVLTCCALLDFMCYFKATQKNVLCSQIQKLTLSDWTITFWMQPKHLLCKKVQLITVTRWFKKFHSGCKNFDDQVRFKESKTMLPVQANLVGSTQRVSGHLSILVQCSLSLSQPRQNQLELANCTSHTTKILQNFWLILIYLKKIVFVNVIKYEMLDMKI